MLGPQDEALAELCLHWLSREDLIDGRKEVSELLLEHVLPGVEENIGTLLSDLALWNRDSELVVVLVPETVVRVLADAHVMSISQRSIVINDTAEIVLARNVLARQEIVVLHVVGQIEIVNRELDESLQLSPGVSHSLESF